MNNDSIKVVPAESFQENPQNYLSSEEDIRIVFKDSPLTISVMRLSGRKTCEHKWKEMHHYGDGPNGALFHYCPTGLKQCETCGHIMPATSEEQRCHLWGRTKDE